MFILAIVIPAALRDLARPPDIGIISSHPNYLIFLVLENKLFSFPSTSCLTINLDVIGVIWPSSHEIIPD